MYLFPVTPLPGRPVRGGSLCSGSGGLDLGLERSLDIEWAWHCEPDPHASRILDERWPGVPNLGDLFAVDWAGVERVDVLAAGFPCPDYSLAGKRTGIEGDHGQVWFGVLDAVRALRPCLCVFENVTGIRTARGLRADAGEFALGVVLADLAALGYRWAYDCMRAADVGAPHGRDRWFCIAALPSAADALGGGVDADGRVRRGAAGEPRSGRPAPSALAAGQEVDGAADALADDPGVATDPDVVGLDRVGGRDEAGAAGDGTDRGGSLRDLPDLLAAATDPERVAGKEAGELDGRPGKGEEQGARREERQEERGVTGRVGDRGDRLLPTPTAGDAKAAGSRNLEGSKAHPGVSLTDAIQTGDSTTPRLLPTPTAEDGERGKHGSGSDRLGHSTFVEGDVRLLPTPQQADGDGGRQEKGAMSVGGVRPSGHKATLPLPTAVSMRETISETPFADVADGEQMELLPTPTGYTGDRVDGQLGTEIAMLPTPVANPENPGAGGELRAAIVHGEGRRNETGVDTLGRSNVGRSRQTGDEPLLPTPKVTASRASRGAMVENQQWCAPQLEQALELARGELPREFESWDEVPGHLGRAAAEGRLLPTPTTQDAENTAGPSQHERNSDPLNVAATKVIDATVSWGVYEAAIRRWEAVLGRDAPAPTDEKGRLDPAFVEWMLGYPAGWFDLPGLKRTAKLRALGNSVQVQCGEVVGAWARELVLSGVLFEQ